MVRPKVMLFAIRPYFMSVTSRDGVFARICSNVMSPCSRHFIARVSIKTSHQMCCCLSDTHIRNTGTEEENFCTSDA